MKKWALLMMCVFLTGCAAAKPDSQAEEFRHRVRTEGCRFSAQVTADYGESRESFSMECRWDPAGVLRFCVMEPQMLAGIRGTVSGEKGTLSFDETVLAMPLLPQSRISPVSGPYVLLKAICEGQLSCTSEQGSIVQLSLRESYADRAAEAELWLEEGIPTGAELSFAGRRNLILQITGFSFGENSAQEQTRYNSSADVGQ